jgi:hypothetical protein
VEVFLWLIGIWAITIYVIVVMGRREVRKAIQELPMLTGNLKLTIPCATKLCIKRVDPDTKPCYNGHIYCDNCKKMGRCGC